MLQEFYVNVTRKVAHPIPKKTARLVVNNYAFWCAPITPAEVALAFQFENEFKIGFWDALIVASAFNSGAKRILSEDLNNGQILAGMRIENPFKLNR